MYSAAAAAVGRALFSEGQLEDPNNDDCEDRLVVVLSIWKSPFGIFRSQAISTRLSVFI